MAEVIWSGNRDRYLLELDQMHERRYRLCFELMGWDPDECGVQRGYDKDEFDRHDTIYIIERHPKNARDVVGFARLNATTGPHMMANLFAHYCNFPPGIPRAPNIYEVSRLLYDWEALGDRGLWKWVRARMLVAMTEFCLRSGIKQLDYVVNDDVFTNIQRQTWRTIPLGSHQRDERLDKTYVAGLSDMDAYGLERVRALLSDQDEDVLHYYGPMTAFALPAVREAA